MLTKITARSAALVIGLLCLTAGGVAVAAVGNDDAALRVKYNDPKAAPLPVATVEALQGAEAKIAPGVARAISDSRITLKPGSARTVTSADGVQTTVARDIAGNVVMAVTADGGTTASVGTSPASDVAAGHMVVAIGGTGVGQGRSIVGALVPDGVTTTSVDTSDGVTHEVPVRNGVATGYVSGTLDTFRFNGTDGQEVGTHFGHRGLN
jgi:YD repeat-containing protein